MPAAARRNVMATAVLAAASVVAVTPPAPRPIELPIRSIETRLVDGSILNVPINLLEDFLNIPYNEVNALNTLGGSLLLSGNWWVPGSTNIWGIDPGDTTHVQATIASLLPFSALDNGFINSQGVYEPGLAYELDGLLAAELPVSASCDALTCAPVVPATQITGITPIDRFLEFFNTLTFGKGQFPLVDNWFKVPLTGPDSLLSGYTFDHSTIPGDPGAGVVDPSGPAWYDPAFGFSNDPGNYFLGGTTGANNAMPWDGHTFTLNPLAPLDTFWQSLLASPSTSGVGGTGIEIPTFTQTLQGFQNLLAGLIVAFDPLVEGSSVCPSTCAGVPEFLSVQALLTDLNPGGKDPMITAYLADLARTTAFNNGTEGTVNNATLDQAEHSIALLQTGFFNLTPAELANIDQMLTNINPELPTLLTNAGILTDPGYLTFLNDPGSTFDPTYGGYNPGLILSDLWNMFSGHATDPAWVPDAGAALGLLDPVNLVDAASLIP